MSTTAAATPLAPLATTTTGVAHDTKRDWHATATLQMRRRVLLQILLLLKTKYGKVDDKISYIARRAELALYSQAFSAAEYRNPKTLNRRLHSLVVKLHMNNLAAKEDLIMEESLSPQSFDHCSEATATPTATRPAKRPRTHDDVTQSNDCKRRRSTNARASTMMCPRTDESPLFFSGNFDLLRDVCSFMDASDHLRLSATNTSARHHVPSFINHIRVSVATLDSLKPQVRTTFFDRFPNLETLEVSGDEHSHLQFDFQNELGLVRRNVICRSLVVALARQHLPKLRHLRWHYAFVDGVQDRITSQLAEIVLNRSRFPRLTELSLVGNAVSDDGVTHLCNVLRATSTPIGIEVLNLEQNFIGERGHTQLQDIVATSASTAVPLTVRLSGNLLSSASS